MGVDARLTTPAPFGYQAVPVHCRGGLFPIRKYVLTDNTMSERKILPLTFTKQGDTFTQLKRKGLVALYSRTSAAGNTCYEVIIVQGHDGREVGGVWIDATEFFPSPSTWGQLGWTYTDTDFDKARAEAKYQERCTAYGYNGPVRRRTPI